MRRTPFLFAAVLAAIPLIAAVPVLTVLAVVDTPPAPQIPAEVRYVCVIDEAGAFISMVTPYPFKPDPADVGTFKANLTSAVNLAGRSMNRPDVIEASATIQLIDNPVPPLATPGAPGIRPRKPIPTTPVLSSGGCHTICSCAKPIFCSTTAPDPGTEAMRKNPNPPGGGGGLCGCGAGCGTCEKCTVVCS